MAHDELTTVYTVSNPAEAEIIKNALENEGLRPFIQQENQGGFEGLISMKINIQVPANEAEHARNYIKKHEHRG